MNKAHTDVLYLFYWKYFTFSFVQILLLKEQQSANQVVVRLRSKIIGETLRSFARLYTEQFLEKVCKIIMHAHSINLCVFLLFSLSFNLCTLIFCIFGLFLTLNFPFRDE